MPQTCEPSYFASPDKPSWACERPRKNHNSHRSVPRPTVSSTACSRAWRRGAPNMMGATKKNSATWRLSSSATAPICGNLRCRRLASTHALAPALSCEPSTARPTPTGLRSQRFRVYVSKPQHPAQVQAQASTQVRPRTRPRTPRSHRHQAQRIAPNHRAQPRAPR